MNLEKLRGKNIKSGLVNAIAFFVRGAVVVLCVQAGIWIGVYLDKTFALGSWYFFVSVFCVVGGGFLGLKIADWLKNGARIKEP